MAGELKLKAGLFRGDCEFGPMRQEKSQHGRLASSRCFGGIRRLVTGKLTCCGIGNPSHPDRRFTMVYLLASVEEN
jgi:hypothetical protein